MLGSSSRIPGVADTGALDLAIRGFSVCSLTWENVTNSASLAGDPRRDKGVDDLSRREPQPYLKGWLDVIRLDNLVTWATDLHGPQDVQGVHPRWYGWDGDRLR